ncbi:MAG: hypothetical protein QXU18_06455 [Thermoplasmatales archaeon]
MFEHNQNPSYLTPINGIKSFLSKEAILKNANRSEMLSKTVDRIVSMAECMRECFLESVTETEEVVMQTTFFVNILYGRNVKEDREEISKIDGLIQSPLMIEGVGSAKILRMAGLIPNCAL